MRLLLPAEAGTDSGEEVGLKVLGKILGHPRLRPFSLTHLIEHDVDGRNREWFAGCMANHAAAFPAIRYELARLALLGAASFAFMPLSLWLTVVLRGPIVAAVQPPHLAQGGDGVNRLTRLGVAAVLRGVQWSAATATCLLFVLVVWF